LEEREYFTEEAAEAAVAGGTGITLPDCTGGKDRVTGIPFMEEFRLLIIQSRLRKKKKICLKKTLKLLSGSLKMFRLVLIRWKNPATGKKKVRG
jgi:hypothetical protein